MKFGPVLPMPALCYPPGPLVPSNVHTHSPYLPTVPFPGFCSEVTSSRQPLRAPPLCSNSAMGISPQQVVVAAGHPLESEAGILLPLPPTNPALHMARDTGSLSEDWVLMRKCLPGSRLEARGQDCWVVRHRWLLPAGLLERPTRRESDRSVTGWGPEGTVRTRPGQGQCLGQTSFPCGSSEGQLAAGRGL